MDESALSDLLHHMGLAMDLDDLKFLQTYFRDTEKRDPTITEVRMVDTYWSDHCRHTTFLTQIDDVKFEDQYGAGRIRPLSWLPAWRSTARKRPPSAR